MDKLLPFVYVEDAIPVAWLENQADNAQNLVVQAVIDYLLTVWRNEQGAKE